MRIEELTPESLDEHVTAALAWVAGMPRASHDALLDEIHVRTERSKASLKALLGMAVEARKVTKYARLKLKSLLEANGTNGKQTADGFILPDPLVPGDEIIVRDAVLLGHRPIVEKANGFSYRIDDYVAALVGKGDTKPFMISREDVRRFARSLDDCDMAKRISPRLLSRPNITAFEEVLKPGEHDRLLVTLRMNERFAIVENGGQIVIFDNATRDAFDRNEFKAKLVPETDIIKSSGSEDGERKSRYKTWFEHPARAHYKSVTFAPESRDIHGRELTLDAAFNLWAGFDVIGVPGDWSLLKEHIKSNLCRGDDRCYDYLLDWMAHLFQMPWDKPGVGVVVWGKKRTGKGTVSDALRAALGPSVSRMFTQKEHVVGRFAGSAQPLMFNQCEEAVFAKNPREEGPLKSKITDPTEVVELKFKSPYEVPSFGRWWFNSNSPTPVPITFDEERYFVLQVSEARANDHEYFAAIRKQLYHEGGLAAVVHELTTRPIDKFNVRKPPVTEHRAKMVVGMLSPEERAVADILIAGEVGLLDTSSGDDVFDPVVLNRGAATWVEKNKVRAVLNHSFKRYGARDASVADITAALKEWGVIDKERSTDARRGIKAAYRFHPLIEARTNFAQKRGIPVEHLTSAEASRCGGDEFQELTSALVSLVGKFEFVDGAPENFAAIKSAVAHLEATVFPTAGKDTNDATEQSQPSLVH